MSAFLFTSTLLLTITVAAFQGNPQVLSKDCATFTDTIPPCIQKKIADVYKGKPALRIGSIVEYEYEGEKVYYITTECCDNTVLLVNKNCQLICKPYADIRGSDKKCKTIVPLLSKRKVIWVNKPRVPLPAVPDSLRRQ